MYLYTMIACSRRSDGWEQAKNWGAREKLMREKIGWEEGGVFSLLPQSSLVFSPLVSFCAHCA